MSRRDRSQLTIGEVHLISTMFMLVPTFNSHHDDHLNGYVLAPRVQLFLAS